MFTQQADVEWAAAILGDRVGRAQRLAEWTSDLLVYEGTASYLPVWRGDCVHLKGYGVYRVRSIDAECELEGTAATWRTCRYVGEYVNASY
jgi:hypothetical protein